MLFSRRRQAHPIRVDRRRRPRGRRLAFPFAIAAISLIQVSCARQPASSAPWRLAVLRFENLGADPASDWVGRALEEVVNAELAGAPELYAVSSTQLLAVNRALGPRPVAAPGISTGRDAAFTLRAARVGYGDYTIRGGRLEARLTLSDPRRGLMVAQYAAAADHGDVIAAATALARQISPHASGYLTSSQAAVHAYVDALEAAGPDQAMTGAKAALAADPGFGPAARLLAGLETQEGDRAAALDCLNRVLARAGNVPVEQARLRLELATLEGQRAARQQALAAVAAAEPANPEAWMELGGAAFARRDYGAAQAAYRKAAELDPDQPAALNQSAYAAAFGGHLDEAVAALRRYQAMRPADPNPIDSLGDVELLSGHPREAEGFYAQAAKLGPHFLDGGDWLKAALARLATGDVAGADVLSEDYVQARFPAGHPAAELYRAQWRFLSGRRREAYRDLEAIAQRQGDGTARALAAEAHTQLAIWSLYLGDRAAAQAHVRAALGGGEAAGQAAALAAFLAQAPAGEAEWSARAEKLAPRPEQARVRDFALAQALLLGKQFAAALPVLQRAYENAAPTDPEFPVLLAWAYLEGGQPASAAPLVAFNPIPEPTGIDAFAACHFPRVFFLRGRLAEAQGRMDAARENYTLFLKLSGDAPFQWGEEETARAKLASK